MSRASIFRRPAVIFLLLAAASLPLLHVSYAWQGWPPASCVSGGCFCEATHEGIVRQPINTYSNLAYVLVGLLVLALARDDWVRGERRNAIQSQPLFPMLFAASTIAIGAGSFFYHASLTFAGQWFDVMGMYLFASFALIYSYGRLRPIRTTTFLLAYLVMNVMLGYLLIVNPSVRRQVFVAMLYAIIAVQALVQMVERPKMRMRYFSGALLLLAVAAVVWAADAAGVLCDPSSLLQGHAGWHVLTAGAAGLLYLFYRSEDGKRVDPA